MPIFFPRKAIIFPLNLVLNMQHTISYQPSRKDHEELEQFMSSETHHEAYDIYACRFSWKTIKFFFQWSQTDSKVANLMLWKNIYRYVCLWMAYTIDENLPFLGECNPLHILSLQLLGLHWIDSTQLCQKRRCSTDCYSLRLGFWVLYQRQEILLAL